MKQIVVSFALSAALGVLAHADSLTTASQYQYFAFSALSLTNGNTTGNAAGGASIITSSATIGGNLVGGNTISLTNGTVGGNVVAGGAITRTNTSVAGQIQANQSSLPVNFAQTQSDLDGDSLYWDSLATTGSASLANSNLTLTGTNASLDIFDVTGAQLSSASTIILSSSIPSTATVIINVSGSSDTWGAGSTNLNNVQAKNVIFNFYQATGVTGTNTSIQGSILAPLATASLSSDTISGNVFASNISELNVTSNGSALFQGAVPFATPEPSSLGLLGLGGLLLVVGRMRSPNRSRFSAQIFSADTKSGSPSEISR